MVDLFMTVSPLLAERDVRLPGGAAAFVRVQHLSHRRLCLEGCMKRV
jgi:hypothetical protein